MKLTLSEVSLYSRKYGEISSLKDSIKSMGEMMEEVINIITLSDLQKDEENSSIFNIRDLCDEVYLLMRSKIEEKKLDYIQMIPPELESINIISEKATVKQILTNLIANALCNIDENGQIKVECMFAEEDKSLIKVTVHDEGKYMSQDEIRKIMVSSSYCSSLIFVL